MSIKKITPSILPGFMELLPKEQMVFDEMVKKITKVYKDNGFLGVDTPIIEKASVLLAKSAGETEKQVYQFTRGNRALALRFDLTVPFARYVAQHYNDLVFPFKRYQIGKVYRGERNQRGRYREFYQCDVDIVGSRKLDQKNDALVVSTVYKALKSIDINEFTIKISNRKILRGLIKELKIQNEIELMTLVDKYDKMDKENFEEELINLIGKEKGSVIKEVINIDGSNNNIISKLTSLDIKEELFVQGMKELETTIKFLNIFGVSEDNLKIDLKIIRGLDYYTGTVFETLLNGYEEYGSISSGGRYDNLAQNYTDNILPGVGMSIGITRLFFILSEIGFVQNYKTEDSLEYLIIPIGDTFEYSVRVCSILQEKGKSVEVYLEDDKFKKKMNYANKLNIKNVILIGDEEAEALEVTLKDMNSGNQEKVKLSDL